MLKLLIFSPPVGQAASCCTCSACFASRGTLDGTGTELRANAGCNRRRSVSSVTGMNGIVSNSAPGNPGLRALVASLLILSTLHTFAVNWVSRHNMTAASYQTEFNQWTQAPYNYRLISVCGYEQAGQARYAAVWEERAGPNWVTHPGMTEAQFDANNATYALQGYVPAFLSAFGIGNNVYYNAIWEHSPGADVVAETGLTHAGYQAFHAARIAQGYKLVHIWTCNAGGVDYYAGIWRKGETATYAVRTRRTSAQYQQEFNSLGNQGYQLIAVSAAVVSGQPLYAGLWKNPGNGSASFSHHGLTDQNYQAQSLNWNYQGYRPVFASAFTTASGPHFSAIFQRNGGLIPAHLALIDNAINGYMQSNGIPGLSLAISRNGRLVYAKGFGLADQSANEWVHPLHRFRIASVSKPITAAAVLKMRDLCGVSLDATVFGPGALLGESFGTPPYSNRERNITLRRLLQHTTGWTTDGIWQVGGDDPDAAIDWQLNDADGEPTSTPGTRYTYMNIGFCAAGRVIERRTGRTYEQFVKDELMAPSCVTEMEIGGSTLAQRKANEVVYYQSDGGSPYDLSPSRMDAHGGWIAKPLDLLLFLRRIDSSTNQAELLQPDSLTAMRTPSMAPGPGSGGTNYGLGLALGGSGWGHNGAMNGTIADLSYRNDGFGFAVACNIRPANDQFAGVVKAVINNAINALTTSNAWPAYDLFPCTVAPGEPPQTMAKTRDIYVDGACSSPIPNGQAGCTVLFGPYRNVNQGASAVCAGDRLWIRTGTYDEAVVLDRFTTVRSYDGAAVVGE
ncbi:MAG TPA: serine hydrolase [Verrucomicrobiae bacterium]|nr:serine hydrolase [Verrucomicrobiae bacterium]